MTAKLPSASSVLFTEYKAAYRGNYSSGEIAAAMPGDAGTSLDGNW